MHEAERSLDDDLENMLHEAEVPTLDHKIHARSESVFTSPIFSELQHVFEDTRFWN
jgi:hypothetical protein